MKLDELGFNRFLFKAAQDVATSDPSIMSSDADSFVGAASSDAGTPEEQGAKEVITGTVITKCLFQTSGNEDRIEINSFLTRLLPGLPTNVRNVDSFVIYKGTDDLYVLINKFGVFSDNIVGTDGYFQNIQTENIYVSNQLQILAGKPLVWVNGSGVTQAYIFGDSSGNIQMSTKTGNSTFSLIEAGASSYGQMKGHLIPSANLAYNLGDAATPLRWQYIYGGFLDLSGGAMVGGTIYGADVDMSGNVEANSYSVQGFAGETGLFDYLDSGSSTHYLGFVNGILVISF